jgi:hypothetical protein
MKIPALRQPVVLLSLSATASLCCVFGFAIGAFIMAPGTTVPTQPMLVNEVRQAVTVEVTREVEVTSIREVVVTATETATLQLSLTPSDTPTITQTPTHTATSTQTFTPTWTLTATRTASPTLSSAQKTALARPTAAVQPTQPPTRPPPTIAPAGGNCDPSYPTVCIPPRPPDLDCGQISFQDFLVLPPDPHDFDRDTDGVGCES